MAVGQAGKQADGTNTAKSRAAMDAETESVHGRGCKIIHSCMHASVSAGAYANEAVA